MNNTTNINNDSSVRLKNSSIPFSVNNEINETLTSNINNSPNDTTNPIEHKNFISFATHNVHGLNHVVKNKQIIENFNLINTDFIGFTETHHKQHQQLQCKYQEDYMTIWSNNFNKFTGVGILIKKKWSNYIHKTYLSNERYLYVDLYLKGHVKMRVIVVYLHANMSEQKQRILLQQELINLINESVKSNFHIVIMGDFNTNLDRYYELCGNEKKIN